MSMCSRLRGRRSAGLSLEPGIALAQHTGLSQREISEAQQLVQEHENDIRKAWRRHFGG